LIIGTLLFGIISLSIWTSYRGVKESALEVGGERLRSITQQLANQVQQSLPIFLNRTFAAANDPAVRAFLLAPSPNSRPAAISILQQFAPGQDPGSAKVELWNSTGSPVLTVPDNSSPESADLSVELKQSGVDPYKLVGPIRVVKDVVMYPVVAAVKGDQDSVIGYLVRWRLVSPTSNARKQISDLLGSEANLYYGNSKGDLFTNLEKAVPRPPVDLAQTFEVTHYTRDGEPVIAMGRPISGTPWFLLVEFPERTFLVQAHKFLRRILIIGVALLGGGVVGALVLSRSITRPLRSLAEAASAIGAGDYSRIVPVRDSDEFGELANAFNSMLVKVRDTKRELERDLSERTARLEAAPSAMLMVDQRGLMTLVNAQLERLFGYERAELLDQPVEMLVPERYRYVHSGHRANFFFSPTTRVMGAGRDLYGRRKDGTEVPIEIGLNPIRTDKGAFVLASIIDITERKRAEERFRLVVEASPSAMIMVNAAGLVTLVNTQTEQLFGYARSELLNQPMEMLVPERYRGAHPGHRASFFQTPSTRSMGMGRELYGLHKDGSEIPIEIGLNPINTDEGAFVLASIIDITERKRADERFRLIIERAPYGKVLVDQQGKITLVNAEIEKCFGYTREELLGQPIEMLVPQRFHAHHAAYRNNFIARPTARAMGIGRELYGLRKDGSEFPVEIGLNPLDTEQGPMVLGTILDITQRRQTEDARRATEARYRTLFENAPDGIVIADTESYYIDANASICRMLGYTRDELIGLHASDIVSQSEQEQIEPALDTIKARDDYHREWQFKRKDGSFFAAEVIATMMPDGNLLGMIRDVTERKASQEDLRRSQQQLAGVIGSAMDAIITIDDQQRIMLFNAAAERMFLFPAEDAIGQPLDRFIPERFRAAHQGHIESFGQTHVTRRSMGTLGALYGLRADGEEFPIEASISQIESDGQKLYTVILRDITERKRADEALKEQARILDLAPVLILDLNGRIIFWNAGVEQMYGWASAEAMDKISHTLLQTEFPRPLQEIKARLFAQNHWQGELLQTRKDGARIVVASHWVVHRDENDKPKAILEVNNDITERKQAEREIVRLNAELEQRVTERTAQLQAVNKELEAFSYSVSHDLRAPLRHIDGFSQALLEDYTDKVDEVGKNYLREVRSATQEMAQLIDDVLQLARVTRSEMHREVVNLSDLARSITAELKKREPKRQVVFNLSEELTTRGDKRLLRIVLNNLLGNAWKFTSQTGEAEITFGGEQKNGANTYFIRDNGAGFDMAYVGKLFGAFQRLHTVNEFEGTGIGLATVQRIVYRHGGRVWAEGAVNEGATFYFTLPNSTDSEETGDGQQSDPAG
jgi:PAS domain S-box-containing protein